MLFTFFGYDEDSELFQIKTFLINENDAGQRLDKFLSKTLVSIPMSLLYKFIRKKQFKINGKRVSSGEVRLNEGDVIDAYISDEFVSDGKINPVTARMHIQPILPEEIAYEDENILVIDKKQGEMVHAALPDEEREAAGEVTLIDRICAYLTMKGEYIPAEENSFCPALCNRLDRNTAGLILAAKNAASLRVLNEKMKAREIKKTYLCAVHGVPAREEETLRGFLYKNRNQNRVFVFSSREEAKHFLHNPYDDDIKTILTKYKLVSTNGTFSLLEVELLTGRTHQIRAHLAYVGLPIVGDGKYGISHEKKNYQALCSYQLTFTFEKGADRLAYLNGKTITSCNAGMISDIMKKSSL